MSSSGRHSFSTDKEMTENLSETESDTSSVMGDNVGVMEAGMKPPSPATREQLCKRIESLLQENRVLKVELETYKLRVRTLQEENKTLKQASVLIQAKAEVEEEFISNTLLKKIQELKKEKETLALNYEQEEECLTNDLSRKLNQLRQEKAHLAHTLQQEQESLVNKLLRKIRKLESETSAKQANLDQLRREKVELENTLEQEQESLVNRLWKRMDKLETEKRYLQEKLEQPLSAPPSPMDLSSNGGPGTNSSPAHGQQASSTIRPASSRSGPGSDPATLAKHIQYLRGEVAKLKQLLKESQHEHTEKMRQYSRDEQQVREENLRLRRKLEMELERRQDLCRHLSESESSLEMEDERHFNELSSHGQIPPPPASAATAVVAATAAASSSSVPAATTTSNNNSGPVVRARTISSPIGYPARPVSPALGGLNVNVTSAVCSPPSSMLHRCNTCGSVLPAPLLTASSSQNSTGPVNVSAAPAAYQQQQQQQTIYRTKSNERSGSEKFVRPANPPTPKAPSPSPAAHPVRPSSANGEEMIESGGEEMSGSESK